MDPTTLGLILDLGVPGLLAFALWTVVQGHWIPKHLHDRIVAQYEAENEKQAKEIARLQERNQEFVSLTLTGALLTDKALDIAKRIEAGELSNQSRGGD